MRLRDTRKICGLTLGQAARLLAIEVVQLSDLELGRAVPTEVQLQDMSNVYGASIAWLRGDVIDPPEELVKLFRDRPDISLHDRDAVLGFAAMIQGKPPSETAQRTRQVLLDGVRIAKEALSAGVEPESKVDAAVSVARKRRYVRSQGQTRKHHCHWPGCEAQVPPAMWGCKAHWFKLPKALRDRIWATYAPGQEVDMSPSDEYLQVADDVQKWIEHEQSRQNWRAVMKEP